MRNPNFQRRLNPSRPSAPSTPFNLRARCLATIPHSVRRNALPFKSVTPRKKTRIQRLSFGGAFLFAALIASAFWSTRPINDSGTPLSTSAAFAQTVRAMQNITGAHSVGRIAIRERGTDQWSMWDNWFDKQRGSTRLRWNQHRSSNNAPSSPSDKRSNVTRSLRLPNGQIYERSGDTLTTWSDLREWKRTQKEVAALALGGAASESSELQARYRSKLTSQQKGQWHGQEAKLFLFLQTPYDKQETTIQRRVYVDPKTNLVIGRQNFGLSKNGTWSLFSDVSIEYTTPDASLFDLSRLKRGVKTIRQWSARR